MPCPCCLGMKCPSEAHSLLDWAFGTLQDLDYTHPPRTAAHLREMQEAYGGSGRTPAELGLATHVSLEPVIVVPPSPIVPLPLHFTIGITARHLRLTIEAVTQDRGSVDGRQFAHRLAGTLSVNIGVQAVPCHGGNFIGRHCHTIASRCGEIVDALLSCLLPGSPPMSARGSSGEDYCQPSIEAALITSAEQARFKADARALVRLLQGSFPWLSISPKLHMLFAHSWEFMGPWGSTGLYGEQAIESWHGFCNREAPRFTAETALLSCRKLVQTMALRGAASEALRRANAPIRKQKAASRGALRPGDRRLR